MSMHAPRHLRTLVAALALLLLCAAAAAQAPPKNPPAPVPPPPPSSVKETDPRYAKNPAEVGDPRNAKDPRLADKDPDATLTGPELYDSLYAKDDVVKLKQQLSADGWQILGYIDSHCEGWLSMIERGVTTSESGKKQAADMQAKGRKLAAMADEALGNTRLTLYVSNFYGWSPEQQKLFREGQKLFKQGAVLRRAARTPQEALEAMTPLQQSLDRARQLGDTWGQAMALAMMGRIQADNGQNSAAQTTMKDAVRFGREIRDLDAVWEGLSVLYETALLDNTYEPAHDALQEQYLLAKELNDQQTSDRVLLQLVELDRRFERN